MKRILTGTIIIVLTIILVIAVVLTFGYTDEEPEALEPPHYEIISHVTSMVDGDTTWVWIDDIVVELDPAGEVYENTYEKVRYGGGIDAPEWNVEGG